jgi:arginyl-tRNA synthetase
MCFAVAAMAGWLPVGTVPQHVSFGSVLGDDHKMLRTRSGDSVRLVDLLDEAVARAREAITEREPDLPEAEREAVARALGIGAVKYADLSTDRIRDYVFNWDRMLAFEGDTGPYLQYANARVRSIFRRAQLASDWTGTAPIALAASEERALGLALLGFGPAVRTAAEESAPSKLCTYLFSLASTFTTFYEHCPILRAPDLATMGSRLALADLTSRVLASGLALLGIEAPARM